MTGQNDSPAIAKGSLKTTAANSVDKPNGSIEIEGGAVVGNDGERPNDKYLEFKGDSDKMQQMDEFVSGLLESAEKEASVRLEAKMNTKKGREGRSSMFTGMRRGRILTRARTVVVRLFEAICNCTTNTASPMARNQARPTLQKANTMAN